MNPNPTSGQEATVTSSSAAVLVICSDGKTRKIKRVAAHADTVFSVPAQVNVGKRTVSGFITTDYDETYFIAYAYGKNADALPAGRLVGKP